MAEQRAASITTAASPWLDEGEARAWRSWLTMGRALERGADRDLMQSSGLSIADYQLLVPLSEAAGRKMRARELGREVGWERSRLSHHLHRMEVRGLVERHECPTDARGTIIVLTEHGYAAIRQAAPSHVAWVREHFIDLLTPKELGALGELADRVLNRIAEDGLCDGAGDETCGDAAGEPLGEAGPPA